MWTKKLKLKYHFEKNSKVPFHISVHKLVTLFLISGNEYVINNLFTTRLNTTPTTKSHLKISTKTIRIFNILQEVNRQNINNPLTPKNKSTATTIAGVEKSAPQKDKSNVHGKPASSDERWEEYLSYFKRINI